MEESYEKAMQMLQVMDKNTELLRSHFKKLREEYKNEYIAIDGGKVVAHNKNREKLRATLESNDIDLTTILIKFIPEVGVTVLY